MENKLNEISVNIEEIANTRVSQVNEILEKYGYKTTAELTNLESRNIEAEIDDLFCLRVYFEETEQESGYITLNSYVPNEPFVKKRGYNDFEQLDAGLKSLLNRYESEKNFVSSNNVTKILLEKLRKMEERLVSVENMLANTVCD